MSPEEELCCSVNRILARDVEPIIGRLLGIEQRLSVLEQFQKEQREENNKSLRSYVDLCKHIEGLEKASYRQHERICELEKRGGPNIEWVNEVEDGIEKIREQIAALESWRDGMMSLDKDEARRLVDLPPEPECTCPSGFTDPWVFCPWCGKGLKRSLLEVKK